MADASRRIPDKIGGTDALFENLPVIGVVETSDAILPIVFTFTVFLISEALLPSSLGAIAIGLFILSVILSFLALFFKPNYQSLNEWVWSTITFQLEEKEIHKQIRTDGGISADGTPITDDEDTRERTRVSRIFPAADAIERTDGTVVGVVRLTGTNLDTATPERRRTVINELSNYVNSNLEHRVQLYLPMRKFDPTEQIQRLEDRRDDDDIDVLFDEYVQDRINWMNAVASEAYIREYYVVVPVSEFEVKTGAAGSEQFASQLEELPAGDILRDIHYAMFGARGTNLSEREVKTRQLEELQSRRREIANGMAVGSDNNTQIVEADELGVLLKEFWEGRQIRTAESENFIRRRPLVMRGDSQ
jgi:hypothetical protein